MNTKTTIRVLALVALLVLVVPAAASAAGWPALTIGQTVSGFDRPTGIVAPDDGTGRTFVTEQGGRVRVVYGGSLLPTPALDIRDMVTSDGERGLLSIAFPAGLAGRQRAYLFYTGAGGVITIARVRVSATDPNVFDRSSMQTLLTLAHPLTNHVGGQLAFGPDGLLYIGLGDGGGAGDPRNNAQNLRRFYGKILRIDVESAPDAGYRVPRSNPYARSRLRARVRPLGEIWARGLRNPWRFSFDPATNSLWIGDVGQDRWEEIDRVGVGRGGFNFGWRRYEGNHPFGTRRRLRGYTWPVAEYPHPEGESVTGGYVYRGAAQPTLYGIYVFGDFATGRIWGLQPAGRGWARALLMESGTLISTFGVDGSGELWFADYGKGTLNRLVTVP